MSDAAITALVTGATAVLSGLLGYAAARGQQLIERARISAEEHRVHAEGARADRDKEVLAKREFVAQQQTLYLEYLKILDEYVLMVMGELRPATYADWWRRFQALDNQMDLFAASAVVVANNAVYVELDAVSSALHSSDTFASDVRRLFGAHREAFEASRTGLVAAMRTEVAASDSL